jgi:hypothetical protein
MHPSDHKVISLEGLEASLEDFKSESPPGAPQSGPSTGPSRLPAAGAKASSGSGGSAAQAHVVSLTPLVSHARSTSVSLADLLSAHTPIEPYEAVAIVQGLCEVVAGSSPLIGTATIELRDVSIHADGTVSSRSTGPGDPAAAIRCMGQLLDQILPLSDSMFLRERVVERATSSPPYYLSFEEFTGTLEYYERPGRAIQVRNVYERWQDRHAMPGAQRGPGLTGAPRALQAALLTASAYRRPLQLALLGATTLAVVFTVGYLVAQSHLFAPAATSPRRASDKPSVPAPEPVAASPATTSGPKTPESPPVSVPPSRAATRPAPSQRAAAPPPIARQAPPPESAAAAATPAPPTGASDTAHITLRLADNTSVPRDPVTPPPPAATRPAEDPAGPETVYSANDRDVVPPSVLFSQLPGPSPVFTPQHDIPALEVYVNERGTVDSVRAIARPRNIAESVVLTNGLSAAKAWRFRPATKDGRAVRYRLIVVLSTD